MMVLTDAAKTKLKEFSEAEGIGHCCVRVKVLSGGCSGFQHELEFDNAIQETDETFDIDGVTLVMDMMSVQYLEGVNLDYIENALDAGFKFSGGAIKSTCGCGNSVSYQEPEPTSNNDSTQQG